MLGRPLVETLALAGDLPEFGGVVQTVARRKDGTELELTLTFMPVGMSQSLEFNGFLEALEIAAPRGNALKQLQRSHRTVVDWVERRHGRPRPPRRRRPGGGHDRRLPAADRAAPGAAAAGGGPGAHRHGCRGGPDR